VPTVGTVSTALTNSDVPAASAMFKPKTSKYRGTTHANVMYR
jgi:hypothetical protein